MKRLLLLLLLCFSVYSLNAQVSLDTAEIRFHLRTAQASFGAFKYPEALVSAQRSLELFNQAPDTLMQLRADTYRILGGIYARLTQAEEARTSLSKAAEIYLQLQPLKHNFLAQIYSNIGISYIQNRPVAFASAIPWFRKAAETILASQAPNKKLIAMDYIGNIGMAHYYLNQFKKAEKAYLEAITYIQEADEQNGDFIGMMEFRLGLLYERKGNLAEALYQYEQALKHYQLKVKEDPLIGNIYRSMGLIHYKRGDYERALLYANKAKVLYAKLIGPATEEYISALDIQSIALTELGRDQLAQKSDSTKGALLKQIYKIKAPIVANHQATMVLKEAELQKDPTIAIEGLQKLLAEFEAMSEPVEKEIAQYTLELGLAYQKKQQFQLAEEQLLRSLNLYRNLYDSQAGEMVQPYFSLASLYTDQEDLEEALYYFQLAEVAARLQLPFNVNRLAYPLIGVEILSKKGQLFANQYTKTQAPEDWQKADSLLKESLNLVELIQASALEENSKISLQDKVTPSLEIHLQLLWEKFKKTGDPTRITDAFKLMERGKNFVLLQSIIRSNTRKYANIPDSLVQQENRLKEDIAFYEKEIFQLQQDNNNLDLEKDWTDLLLELKTEQKNLQKITQQQFPEYFNLKNQTSDLFSLDQLQRKLEKNQAFLEYFVGEKALFILKIEADEVAFFQVEKTPQLESWVEALQQSLIQVNADFVQPAQDLYRQLVEPLGQLPRSLIIVPDGILAYLPFEVLLSGQVSEGQPYTAYPFLLQDKQISYNFSGALWEQMSQKKHPKRGLLALAPSFNTTQNQIASRSRNLGPLTFNQAEVEQISPLFKKKKIYLDTNATLENFLSSVQQYHILHLATHAKVDDLSSDFSYLAFYGATDSSQQAKLFVRDLFALQLPLDLVTLSACETGLGVLQKGEGVVSLARGFAYAGAKSMVTSLWAANDLSTAEIMTDFYKSLKKGNRKDEALRSAKLNFLNQSTLAHPHYWATFIPVGDMAAIQQNTGQTKLIVGLFLSAVLVGLFFFFRIKQHKG